MAWFDGWTDNVTKRQEKKPGKPLLKWTGDPLLNLSNPNSNMNWSYQPDPYSNLEESPMYKSNPYIFENPSGLVGEPVLEQKKQPGAWHPPMALPQEPSPNLPPYRGKPKGWHPPMALPPESDNTFPFDGGENIDQAVDWAANKAVEGVPHYLKPKAFSTARKTIESNIQKGINKEVKTNIQKGIDEANGKVEERPNPYDMGLKTPNATDDMYPALPEALPAYTPPENPYESIQRPEANSQYPEYPEMEKYTQIENKNDQEIKQLLGEDDQLWNLKPLLNLTDNLFGGNLADGYTDPNELAYKRKNQKLTMLNSMAGREVDVKKANNGLKLAEFNAGVAKYKFNEEMDYKHYKEYVEAQRKVEEAKAKVAEAQMKRQEKLDEELRKNKRDDRIKSDAREFTAEQNRLGREAAKERTLLSGSKKKDPKVMTPGEYSAKISAGIDAGYTRFLKNNFTDPQAHESHGDKDPLLIVNEAKALYLQRYPTYDDTNPDPSSFLNGYYLNGVDGIPSSTPVTPSQPPVSQPSVPSQPSSPESIDEYEQIPGETTDQYLERLRGLEAKKKINNDSAQLIPSKKKQSFSQELGGIIDALTFTDRVGPDPQEADKHYAQPYEDSSSLPNMSMAYPFAPHRPKKMKQIDMAIDEGMQKSYDIIEGLASIPGNRGWKSEVQEKWNNISRKWNELFNTGPNLYEEINEIEHVYKSPKMNLNSLKELKDEIYKQYVLTLISPIGLIKQVKEVPKNLKRIEDLERPLRDEEIKALSHIADTYDDMFMMLNEHIDMQELSGIKDKVLYPIKGGKK